ncbi:MAG: hypothetical protein CL604_18385 [Alteromonadaceae bacterium]|nr:hypothetical protein [Alteromonadaceae bacterium]
MVRIIRFDSLLKNVAYATVALSIGIYAFVQATWLPDYPLFKVVTISTIVSTFLVTLLVHTSFSRRLWALIGRINESVYPDLNGTWQGEITLENGKTIDIRAVIRQSLLSTEIDIHGEMMKSVTLETTPSMEAGQKKLYYVYRADPKNPAWPSYSGSTIFDVRRAHGKDVYHLELSGRYFTDRKTVGRIVLRQLGTDNNHDVSFY